MDILSFSCDNFYTLSISINLLAFAALLVLCICVSLVIKKCVNKAGQKNIVIDEVKLGIGSSSVTITYHEKEREIAYKLWVELNTRKIGLPFDEDHDFIIEVYDSWYKCFGITRDLLKEIPVNRLTSSSQLINLMTDVLNKGFRSHLSKWQAEFRQWYDVEKAKNPGFPPQELQKKYPRYDFLVEDLKVTNQKMIHYKDMLHEIAFCA